MWGFFVCSFFWFAFNLPVFYFSFYRESLGEFSEENEVYTVLTVTIKRGSANRLAVLNPMKGFDSHEGKSGAAWVATTTSPLLPLSLSLIPSPSVGEPSCASRAQRCPVVRAILPSHRSQLVAARRRGRAWRSTHVGLIFWRRGKYKNDFFNKNKKASPNLGCHESQLLGLRGWISL